MRKLKLNIGSGDIKLDGYTNLDGKFGDDITHLKYPNNSVDEIYASHVLEYFDQFECIDVLREWNRVLKKGGIIRIAVPNFNELAKLYLGVRIIKSNNIKQINLTMKNNYNIKDIIGPMFGRMEMGDKVIYHKQVFDFDTLSELLYRTGFKRVKTYDCEKVKPFNNVDDQSHAYLPHMDKKGWLISLNMEATK